MTHIRIFRERSVYKVLSIIVAIAKNNIIGYNNKMPWHYPEDLQYFKEVTWGKKVVMGSRTYESILNTLHKPLPNRHNIVITHNKDKYKDVECFGSVEEFLTKYRNSPEEIFIIGGRIIYEQFLNFVDKLYITHINKEYPGDTYFPKFDSNDFKLIKEKASGELLFCIYERKVLAHE